MKKMLLTTALTVLMTGSAFAELDKCPDISGSDATHACKSPGSPWDTQDGRHTLMAASTCPTGSMPNTLTNGVKLRQVGPSQPGITCQYETQGLNRFTVKVTEKGSTMVSEAKRRGAGTLTDVGVSRDQYLDQLAAWINDEIKKGTSTKEIRQKLTDAHIRDIMGAAANAIRRPNNATLAEQRLANAWSNLMERKQ